MNFFERQRQVRRMSTRLVILFVVAVIGIIAVVDLAAALAFGRKTDTPAQLAGIIITVSLLTLVAIVLAAGFRMLSLRGGGGVVARGLGGVLVPQDTADPQLRRLRNVVEEIAIASGTPVPEVYLLPHEEAINAFAAGWSTSDAAVAVTKGALERLNRTELQGVIAHEFSHVVNGDMRLNIRLMGLLFGILFLSIIGRTLTYTGLIGGGDRRDGDRNSGNPLAILGFALLIAGFVGVLVGRLIKAAVSRQREYLADASAVQFTRQPSGLVGALAKIAGLEVGSKLRNPRSEEVGHMLFGSGAKLDSWFATHPPLLERIKVLDPAFDTSQLQNLSRQWAAHPPQGLEEDISLGLAPAPAAPLPAATTRVPATESTVVAGIGTQGSFAKAEELIGQLPLDLLDRARHAETVVPLVLGLLLSDNQDARTAQHALLTARYGKELADAAWTEANAMTTLHPLLRLPLAELSFPALRQRSDRERSTVVTIVFDLIHADGRITPYEYCLSRLITGELTASMQPQSSWRSDRRRLTQSPAAVALLLAVLARAGNADPAAAEHAYRTGLDRVLPGTTIPYAPPAQGVTALETAWPSLIGLSPEDTQRLVAGVVAVISDDGMTTITEMELLRTMCAVLHCPLPL
ncbi:MAG TPA: M48 family metallopeptidase [Candidatus Limnocylindria bacterium]|nr:M48 family metallopeptidase [Candidatus Limnocylindria bacterium]